MYFRHLRQVLPVQATILLRLQERDNMNDFKIALLMVLMFIQGITVGYILWAPLTPFKQGLIDGLSLKFLWRKQ